jgi:cell division protease FtsH
MFGELSTGAQNDLQRATELAREMVTEFGMSEQLGPVAYSQHPTPLVPMVMEPASLWSERTARTIDEAIRALVEEARQRALDLLTKHKETLAAVAAALKDKEAIAEEELKQILLDHGIEMPQRRQRADQPPVEAPAKGAPAGHSVDTEA